MNLESPIPDQTRTGLFVIQKGRFRHVNERLASILGYAGAAELIGQSFWNMIHPHDRHRVCLGPVKSRHPQCKTDAPYRLFKCDGTIIRATLQGANTIYEHKPAHVGCLTDVTTLCRMKESLEKHRAMLDEVEDAVVEVDLAGNITFANFAACKALGASSDETVGLNYKNYVDEPSAEHVYRAYKAVFDSGRTKRHIQYAIGTPDGQRFTVEDSVTPIFDPTDKIVGFRTVSRNITEQKRAEREAAEQRTRLEAIFKGVKDAIITVGPDMRVIEANDAAQTICGLNKQEMSGRHFSGCRLPCSQACMEMLRQTIGSKESIKEHQVACGIPGRRQIVAVSSTPLLDDYGHFLGAALVVRDISRLRNLEQELRERHQYRNIIGQSRLMKKIFEFSDRLATLNTTVLVSGESGTGKELIARALHYKGSRAAGPFVTVNCSALTETLLESELFGHVKGAFTGALQDKKGRFQAADGGSLLLDEIGDVSPMIQLKLLRFLEEKEFERVGESTTRQADVRVIASTNKDLRRIVKSGHFREDLYYRLKVAEITMPPLRKRLDDLPLLISHFCHAFNLRFNKTIEGLSREAQASLMVHHWPGNVRELEHLLERAFVLCHERIITMAHLPPEFNDGHPSGLGLHTGTGDQSAAQVILNALEKTFWNRTKAAELLGISRQTLRRKIKAYALCEASRHSSVDRSSESP